MLGHGWAFLTAQQVKNPPVRQETQEAWVRSLGQEDLLEKWIASQSSIPAWEISWTKEHGGAPLRQSKGPQIVGHE